MPPPAVVPAMGLARGLEDLARAAAISPIPSLLMDLESIPMVRVGQVPHTAPDVQRTRGGELPQVDVAAWVGGRIVRVVLESAVGATGITELVYSAPIIVIAEVLRVPGHFLDGLVSSVTGVRLALLIGGTALGLSPVCREGGHVRLDWLCFSLLVSISEGKGGENCQSGEVLHRFKFIYYKRMLIERGHSKKFQN